MTAFGNILNSTYYIMGAVFHSYKNQIIVDWEAGNTSWAAKGKEEDDDTYLVNFKLRITNQLNNIFFR